MITDLADFVTSCGKRMERALDATLPSTATLPSRLHLAMRHGTLGGGKRIRPMLLLATADALGHDAPELDKPACAIELIHAYSLIHDDLPAMDDDDLRRGKPTVHKAFDEATAILAGDALQALAFHLLADYGAHGGNNALAMVGVLARAAGSRGMCGGQAMDIDAVGQEMTLPELESMHIHKTGALIRASVQMGALAGNADEKTSALLDHYAKCVGLAFQIRDDILDVEGDSLTLGKTSGKDQADSKPTYTSLLGIVEAKERCAALHQQALDALQPLGENAGLLSAIAHFAVCRNS